MNAVPTPSVAVEINRLHEEAKRASFVSRQALHSALAAAWQAGQLLVAEKKRVGRAMGPGAWLLWLEANFRGTPRTAQRYMKLARSVADISFLQGLSLRQTYARLGIATEPKRPGHRLLAHRLPPHLLLANKLLRALKHPHGPTLDPAQREHLCRDLRPLFEALRPWFTGLQPRNTE